MLCCLCFLNTAHSLSYILTLCIGLRARDCIESYLSAALNGFGADLIACIGNDIP